MTQRERIWNCSNEEELKEVMKNICDRRMSGKCGASALRFCASRPCEECYLYREYIEKKKSLKKGITVVFNNCSFYF